KQGITAMFGLVLILNFTGCISPDAAMKSFMGQPSSELVARWGPPPNRMSDSQGGEIWTYFEQRQVTTPGYANTTVYGTGNTDGNVYRNPYGGTYNANSSAYGNATTTYTPA